MYLETTCFVCAMMHTVCSACLLYSTGVYPSPILLRTATTTTTTTTTTAWASISNHAICHQDLSQGRACDFKLTIFHPRDLYVPRLLRGAYAMVVHLCSRTNLIL
ncbi:hypothetical protein F4808DRAFT_78511 [Astrocystis sublimbata]|nr:hypothetical protein F4808DRAFT_78511 [Astrocystis sublimbata]